MKKVLVVILLGVCVTFCKPVVKEATIGGVIENSPSDHIELYYVKDFATNERESIVMEIAEDNSFSGTIPLVSGQFVQLKVGRYEVPLYLLPGSDLNISFDVKYKEVLPVIEGQKVDESRFLVSYNNDVALLNTRSMFYNLAASKSAFDYVAALETSLEEKLKYLRDYEFFESLDKDFVSALEDRFLYEKLELLMLYPRAWQAGNPDELPEIPQDYYDFLGQEGVFKDSAANSAAYFNFATEYLQKCIADNEIEAVDEQEMLEQAFHYSDEIFSGKTWDGMLAKSMLDLVRYGNLNRVSELFPSFKEKVSNAYYLNFVDDEYQKIAAVAPGKPAPDFTLVDIDGNEVSMSDFKGKVVYLDFWASWCPPCMREVPHAKELKKRMEGKDVVFLYISVDEDEDAWRKTVAEKEIQGVHLNVPGRQHPVTVSYAVRGIPKFMIIGRDGFIIDNVAPRPSNNAIDQALADAL